MGGRGTVGGAPPLFGVGGRGEGVRGRLAGAASLLHLDVGALFRLAQRHAPPTRSLAGCGGFWRGERRDKQKGRELLVFAVSKGKRGRDLSQAVWAERHAPQALAFLACGLPSPKSTSTLRPSILSSR